MARHWVYLQRFSPALDAYEAELDKQWRQIGCAPEGAPFVLAGLIRNMADDPLFARNSPHASQLAADFLKDDCAGARGLPDDAKATLQELRKRVPPAR